LKKSLMALASSLALAYGMPAAAATCTIHKGGWICGGATLKEAKDACNVTVPNGNQTCDAGINVCTCNASLGAGRVDSLQTPGARPNATIDLKPGHAKP